MTRTLGTAHLQRDDDGVTTAMWASYALKSAFQPIFAFRDGKLSIAAFEGLIRPFRDGEPVTPRAFFQSIAPQDRFVAETVTRTLHLLNAGVCLDPAAAIFINFDPSQFSNKEIAEAALREMRLVLRETGIEPSRIVCEMTEHVSASEPTLFSFVEALRSHGFRIAVDDYGADHSDIRRVEQLRPDIVKFDADWITTLMDSGGAGFALIKTMVDTFHDKGFQTVFEGLEEGWQLDLAEQAGVTMVQGYILARPQLAPTDFAAFRVDPVITAAEAGEGADGSAEYSSFPSGLPAMAATHRHPRNRVFGRRQSAP